MARFESSGRAGLDRRGGGGGVRPGFTLVEILVVVVILGIAAAVIVPSMGSRDDLRASAAARVVMADLIYAQNRAISTQQRHYIIFTTTAPQNYRLATSVTPLVDVPHPVTLANEYVQSFGTSAAGGLSTVTLGDVRFELDGQTIISFDELGVPSYYDTGTGTNTALATSGGSGIEVRCGTHTLRIVVEPYTGEIRVE